MSLSNRAGSRLVTAVGDNTSGNEIATALNNASAGATQDLVACPAAIVAAHVSQTTDFAALKVGDLVVHIPAVAGNSVLLTVATAGTLPIAAVIGDLYMVLRPFVPAPATTFTPSAQ